MWIWHTETNSVKCAAPCLSIEVFQIDGKLNVITQGTTVDLKDSVGASGTLSELLIHLEKWLDKHALSASGIVGYECQAFLDEMLYWVEASSPILELKGESLVFAVQAGSIQEQIFDSFAEKTSFQHTAKKQFIINQEILEGVTDIVSRGLQVRQKLDSDHLVVSTRIPVSITNSLQGSWLRSVQTNFPQGFLMQSDNWELVSCTPERFISIADSKLQVDILAGTFKEGTAFDKNSLIDEHQAARSSLRSRIESTIGELKLIEDCGLVEFDEIKHFHSRFEKDYQVDGFMLLTLATLTPSPATGAQDRKTRFIIEELESRPRGYYGGCFFLRTPGCLESLVSIRSIFCSNNSEIGEMIVGAGFKKGSTLNDETAELISKATSCARLLGIQQGR